MSEEKEDKLSFLEEVRQSIRESNAKAEERNAEWAEKMQELRNSQKETEEIIKKLSIRVDATTAAVDRTSAAVDRAAATVDRTSAAVDRTTATVNQTSKHLRGISLSNGAMAEEMIFNSLEKDKTFGGIKFDKILKNVNVVSGFETKTELDVLMVNGDTVAIIEAKYKVDKDDVNELFTKQLNCFRQYYPDYSKHKVILGIGGMSFEKGVIQTANKKGIGIIKIVGDKLEFHTDGIKN